MIAAVRSAIVMTVALAAISLPGCASTSDSGGGAAPDPDKLTVKQFNDLSLPRQSDVLQRYYERDHVRQCPNVTYRGAGGDLLDKVRNDALDEPGGEPIRTVLAKRCSKA